MTSLALAGLCAAAVLAFVAWQRARVARSPMVVAADDPLMLAAYGRARESIALLREHLDAPQVAIKFAYRNARGETEHVWGEVDAIDDDHVSARIATPLVHGPTPDASLRVALADVEDWQAFLADGRIRGGFTTQAQIAIARRDGHPIPRDVLRQEGRFVDR